MMKPSIFGENLFEDWMDFPFDREFFGRKNPLYGKHARNMMKTDVKENADNYEVFIDLPGFKKDEMSVALEDGYLTIEASKSLDKDEQEKESGNYIRKERYAGSMSRSFYVGDAMTEEDIHAKYEKGILKLTIPKKEQLPQKQNSQILIEG